MPPRVVGSAPREAEQQVERELIPPVEQLGSDGVAHEQYGRRYDNGTEHPDAKLALVRTLQQEGEPAVAHADGARQSQNAGGQAIQESQPPRRAAELSERAGDEHTAGDADAGRTRCEHLESRHWFNPSEPFGAT